MKKILFFMGLFCACMLKMQAQEIMVEMQNIPDSLKKDANTVYQVDESLLDISAPGKYVQKVHQVFTILNKDGAFHFTQRFYIDKNIDVDDIDIRVSSGLLGKDTKKYKKKDFTTVAATDEISLVRDGKMMYLRMAEATYPCTMEISYKREVSSFINIPGWFFNNYSESVQLSRFVVKIPKSMGLRYKPYNTNIAPVVTTQDEKEMYTWEARNLRPAKREEGSGQGSYLPSIRIAANEFSYDGYKGELKDWKTFGAWNFPMYEESKNPFPENRRQEIQHLVKDAKNENEKISILYKYMQKNMRYVSIQLGIGGFKPFAVSFVDEKKYGDCKALSNYMRYLLKEVGIKSYTALVKSQYDADSFDKDFPSDVFDHVILCVPRDKDTIWLECTSKTQDFAVLGNFTENRYALLLTENGGVLVPTPKSRSIDNTTHIHTAVSLDESGSAICLTNIIATGSYKEQFAYFIDEKKDDQKMFLVKYWGFKQPDEFSYTQKEESTDFTVDLKLQIEKVPEFTAGSKMFLNPQIYKHLLENKLPAAENRKEDYYFEYPFNNNDTTVYKLPEGFVVDVLPKAQTFSCSYGSFSSKYWYNEQEKAVYSIASLELLKNRIPAGSYKEVKTFFESVNKEASQRIVIKKG